MKNKNNFRLFLLFLIIIGILYHAESTSDDSASILVQQNNNATKKTVLADDSYLKSLIITIVENKIAQRKEECLPESLLRCYEQLTQNKTECDENTLQEAFSDIMHILEMIPEESRYSPGVLFGPLQCDLAGVYNYLSQEIYPLLTQCCANNSIDFSGTLTVLAAIENILNVCCETITNDFAGTFTVLAHNQNDLTTCCEEVANDFQGTYSVIAFGFNSTYSILTNNFDTIFFDLTTDLNELNTLLTDISGCFNTLRVTFSICCFEVSTLITWSYGYKWLYCFRWYEVEQSCR